MPRTLHQIAAEAQALADLSAEQFVPLPADRVAALAVEFMAAVAAIVPTPA